MKHPQEMEAVESIERRASAGRLSSIERLSIRPEAERLPDVQVSLWDLSEQAKSLCPRPADVTISSLERILERPVARKEADFAKGYLDERDASSIQELEVLTRRLGILSMLCVKKRAALCRRMNIVRCRTYGVPLFREGENSKEFFIVLHGSFQCIGRIYNGNSVPIEWTSEVRPGQDFCYEMGIGSDLGCISTAVPLLSKPSGSTVISDETQKLLARIPTSTKLPRVKVCCLLSLDLDDFLTQMEPNTHRHDRAETLRSVPCNLNVMVDRLDQSYTLQAIAPLFRAHQPKNGDVILESGGILDRFFFVSSGSVLIVRNPCLDRGSISFTIAAPGIFGEEAVIRTTTDHIHSNYRVVCNSEGTEILWASSTSIRDRLHPHHLRFLEHLAEARIGDADSNKDVAVAPNPKILSREQKLRSSHSQLVNSSFNIDASFMEEGNQNADTLHVMQSDRAFYKRFAPVDDADLSKFKHMIRASSPLAQDRNKSIQLPYKASDFKDEDDEIDADAEPLVQRSPSVDLLHHSKGIQHIERSKSAQSADHNRSVSPSERPRFNLSSSADSKPHRTKRGDYLDQGDWVPLLSKPWHGLFALSHAPKAILKAKKDKESKFLASKSIPLLLETKKISYRTEMVLNKNDYVPTRANFDLPAQLGNSFLGLYMPFNNKYIAHARKTAIKREEIEYNRLRRK